ncbi:N-formylglutamate amidohydrolase [Amylibacter kogurei]|uniref:N-formylglutamate amidohydrolase n=1 Tax=Paramylibacter kogurei TaxID=1889778 RepID=A0A2G5JZV1_9RHOB|nr:N-formylglutamate amidohydrolase [Amylibacter kogurei]PIB22816.1 N-formylglutamate amidohydrolase [Amylibacter kogurei]
MTNDVFSLSLPTNWTSSTVFSSPHSGRDYTDSYFQKSNLSPNHLRSSEDAFVDELFSSAPESGAPLMAAVMPRAFIDLNRGADELDSAIIEDVKPTKGNPRTAAGLGVIPRVVSQGRAIQTGKISHQDAQDRIANYYVPYHQRLKELINQTFQAFGESLLVDCHSMPHTALDNISVRGGSRPDVIIGDRFGSACAPEVADKVEAAFRRQGFIVARNLPFAGAYILREYGRPTQRRNAVQVEIDRALYMDEASITKNDQFGAVKKRIDQVILELAEISQAPLKFAAE